jgi:hypothetical protein
MLSILWNSSMFYVMKALLKRWKVTSYHYVTAIRTPFLDSGRTTGGTNHRKGGEGIAFGGA